MWTSDEHAHWTGALTEDSNNDLPYIPQNLMEFKRRNTRVFFCYDMKETMIVRGKTRED
jgi:hypothetical protein